MGDMSTGGDVCISINVAGSASFYLNLHGYMDRTNQKDAKCVLARLCPCYSCVERWILEDATHRYEDESALPTPPPEPLVYTGMIHSPDYPDGQRLKFDVFSTKYLQTTEKSKKGGRYATEKELTRVKSNESAGPEKAGKGTKSLGRFSKSLPWPRRS
jgi:hypothetical protein